MAILKECGGDGDVATVTWIISHPEMEVLVAADPLDKPFGFVTFSHRPLLKLGGRAGTIDELAVTASWRRKGAARELLKRVVERAKVLSVRRLEAHAFGPATTELIAFFRRCGFDHADVGVFRMV